MQLKPLKILFISLIVYLTYFSNENMLAANNIHHFGVSLQDTVINSKKDTIKVDSTKRKTLFKDIVTFGAKDSIINNMQDQTVELFGKAKIKYLSTQLEAAYIKLSFKTQIAEAHGVRDTSGNLVGNPIFSDNNNKFDCKELKYNFKTKKGVVTNLITEDNGGFVHGKLTKKIDSTTYCVKNGLYTTCDHKDHPHFYINMSKAKMIKDDKVVAGFSYLVVEEVPLPLFIPFGFFPMTKKGTSGIIIPTYGEERMRGFNLKNGGYFWAINDYINMTILGSIYTNGSWGTNINSSYKKRYKYTGSFNLSTSTNYTGEEGSPDYSVSKDYAIRWTHTQDPKAHPYRTLSASVDISSSKNDYFNKHTINDIANQRKRSSISYSRRWPDSPFSLTMAFSHSQNSRDSTITMSFPNLHFKMNQIYPLRKKEKVGELKWYDKISLSYTAEFRNSTPDRLKESKLLSTSFKKWKKGFKHSIPIGASFKLFKDFSFQPSFNYEGVMNFASINKVVTGYNTDTNGAKTPIIKTDTTHGFNYSQNYRVALSLNYTPKVFGMYVFDKKSRIAALRHVISPSLSFTYTPKLGFDNSHFMNRYSYLATDDEIKYQEYYKSENVGIYNVQRTPDKHQGSINLSIDNNLELKLRNINDTTKKVQTRKVKILESFRINANYDVFKDSMKLSQIGLSARTSLFKRRVNLNLTGNIDPYALDANGNRINKFHGGLGRLTRFTATTGMNFSSKKSKDKQNANSEAIANYTNYVDFNIPWNVSINYSYNYQKLGLQKSSITQMMRVTGDFNLTPKWKLRFNTGYDITRKEITATSFSVYRDLHCWEMNFSCMPFGTHQSYNFEIRIKSSMLRDLKLTKKNSWYDNSTNL